MNNPYAEKLKTFCDLKCLGCDFTSQGVCTDVRILEEKADAWEEGYKEGVEEVKALRVVNLELVKQLKEARNGCPTETQIKNVLARYQQNPKRYEKTLFLSEVAKIIKQYWKQDDEADREKFG